MRVRFIGVALCFQRTSQHLEALQWNSTVVAVPSNHLVLLLFFKTNHFREHCYNDNYNLYLCFLECSFFAKLYVFARGVGFCHKRGFALTKSALAIWARWPSFVECATILRQKNVDMLKLPPTTVHRLSEDPTSSANHVCEHFTNSIWGKLTAARSQESWASSSRDERSNGWGGHDLRWVWVLWSRDERNNGLKFDLYHYKPWVTPICFISRIRNLEPILYDSAYGSWRDTRRWIVGSADLPSFWSLTGFGHWFVYWFSVFVIYKRLTF